MRMVIGSLTYRRMNLMKRFPLFFTMVITTNLFSMVIDYILFFSDDPTPLIEESLQKISSLGFQEK